MQRCHFGVVVVAAVAEGVEVCKLIVSCACINAAITPGIIFM